MKFIPKNNLENPSKIIFSNVRQRVSNSVVKRKSARSTTCSGVGEQFDSPHEEPCRHSTRVTVNELNRN